MHQLSIASGFKTIKSLIIARLPNCNKFFSHAGSGVTANSLHPGAVNTDLQRHSNRGIMKVIMPIGKLFFKTPVNGAQTTLRCALDPKLEEVSGKYFE